MAARNNLKSRIQSILKGALPQRNRSSVVRVERRHYKNHVHVWVISPTFRGMERWHRAKWIWDQLRDRLSFRERLCVTGVIGLTPAEEKRLLGNSVK